MSLAWRWMGRVDYREALAWQRARREEVLRGGEEVIALLEHPRTLTTGRREVEDLDRARAAGIEIVGTERGGLATWHGPGQLVVYPIIDLNRRGLRVRDYVAGLEQAVITWLGTQGISAGRRVGFPGVWVGREKICAIGTHFRRGVSLHGFALNLRVDLSDFSLFTPCGIADGGVTSADRHGCSWVPEEAASSVALAVLRTLTPSRTAYTNRPSEDT